MATRQTGMKGLQQWCKNVTQGYKGVEVTNMTKSFRDGLAFCAIIHHYRPDLIPFDSLKKGDVERNNALAFKVAEQELDIPALLDVEDMVELEIPDKLSIATYLISYYNYFKDKQPAKPLGGTNLPTPVACSNLPLSTVPNTEVKTNAPSNQIKPNKPPQTQENTSNVPPKSSMSTPKQPFLPPNKPPVAKTVSTPARPSPPLTKSNIVKPPPPVGVTKPAPPSTVTKDNAGSKLSEGLFKLQKIEANKIGSPSLNKPSAGVNKPSSPVKKPNVPVVVLDSTPSDTPTTQKDKSLPRGRRQKFSKPEKTEGESSNQEAKAETSNLKPSAATGNPPPKPFSRRKSEKKRQSMVNELCEQCQNRVFLLERLCVEGHIFHRKCFKCCQCGEGIQAKSYEYDVHEDKFYCRLHFQEMNRNKSIKRNMMARGVTNFEGKECIVLDTIKQKKDSAATEAEQSEPTNQNQDDEWDIIPTPPPDAKSPPVDIFSAEAQNKKDEQMKQDLPTVLSELAQKKKQHLSRVEPRPESRPPTVTSPKKPMLPTTVSKSNKPTEQPPLDKERSPSPSKKKPPVSAIQPANKTQEADDDKAFKPRPPKPQRVNSKREKTTVLEHYEFSPQYYEKDKEAKEILMERYEHPPISPSNASSQQKQPMDEVSPYEVPVPKITKPRSTSDIPAITQPNKPHRGKRTAITVHRGDTWIKPYAVTPLGQVSEEKTPTNGSDTPPSPGNGGRKPKPARPAPPLPYAVKSKQKPKSVSPYAVSKVNAGVSSATDELQRKRRAKLSEYKKQLNEVDSERQKLERKGVELEQKIRSDDDQCIGDTDNDPLIEEWFCLVNEKDQVIRKESELVYMIRDIELIEEKEQLEKEVRRRLAKDDSTKSEREKAEDEAMIEELTQLVMKRDQLMWQFDEDKIRDFESEAHITRAMSVHTKSKSAPSIT